MIRFRLREYGSTDWTEISFDGELEDQLAETFAARMPTELHLQR